MPQVLAWFAPILCRSLSIDAVDVVLRDVDAVEALEILKGIL